MVCATSLVAATAVAQAPFRCEAEPERHAYLIPWSDSTGEAGLAATSGAEVRGNDDYSATLPNGWQFVLMRIDHGWAIRIYDQPYSNGRVDLSAITRPLRGPTNPRDIVGWHFRNRTNTGPNLGGVNAPQRMRSFQFDGALAGTGGLRPAAAAATVVSSSGRGLLKIVDFELAGLEPQGKASMTYLKFQVCLSWPKLPEAEELARAIEHERRARELDAQVLVFSAIEHELFGSCGLDLTRYRLTAAVAPRQLSLDIDGDDAQDTVAQVTRIQDGRRGLALCRAGTWLHLLGFDQRFDAPTRHLLSAMEVWRMVPPDHGPLGYVDEAAWPKADGDVLLVERIEKGMALFYWSKGAIHTQRVYGMRPVASSFSAIPGRGHSRRRY